MLFNSYIFLFIFLPVSVLGYTLVRKKSAEGGLLWLNLCSLFFYGWSNPAYLPLLLASITANFFLGKKLAVAGKSKRGNLLLTIGILLNLFALGYFKYSNFALANINALLGTTYQDTGIALPLAISFFTFNQIAYLLDSWEGMTEEYRFNHYCLFVSFFPHLLAGPIVHHRELIPQFSQPLDNSRREKQWAVGLTVISFGLFKKVIFADSLSYYADQVFANAAAGNAISTTEAWIAALSYNLQIYFDFSAYCDIAYGSALFFGIILPQNFISPFKAPSIIDYWKRWHITLGRLITTYIYTPLIRSTPGRITFSKAMLVTVISMTIVGLWHGAGWHFIIWGLAHGFMLVINHLWRKLTIADKLSTSTTFHLASVFVTYTLVTLSMVMSRAPDVPTANLVYQAMFSFSDFQWTHNLHQPVISDFCRQIGVVLSPMQKMVPLLLLLQCWVWMMPNLQQLMSGYEYASTTLTIKKSRLTWSPNAFWCGLSAIALAASLMALYQTGEFIYFQF